MRVVGCPLLLSRCLAAPGGAAVDEADFLGGFAKAVTNWQEQLTHHPRPGPLFRLRTSPQELTNNAMRLVREQYRPGAGTAAGAAERAPQGPLDLAAPLRTKGALLEVRLSHPALPFVGVLDRVWLDGESPGHQTSRFKVIVFTL